MDLDKIDDDGTLAWSEQTLTEAEVIELKERLKRDFDTLIKHGGPIEGRMVFEDIIDSLCADLYGFTFRREVMKVMKAAAFDSSCAYQPLNNGKAFLISPYGYHVVEESITKKYPTLLVLREVTRDEHEKKSY